VPHIGAYRTVAGSIALPNELVNHWMDRLWPHARECDRVFLNDTPENHTGLDLE